jgi:peptidoglycan/LPS O-acetylase OafA/YrhL
MAAVLGLTPAVSRPVRVAVPAAAADKTAHLAELDGLRGLAALCAIAYHYTLGQAARSPSFAAFKQLLEASPFALDTFFILSGFLIGGILLRTRSSPNYFRTFYLRRFFRIIPLYYCWIAVYLVLLFSHVGGWGLPPDRKHGDLFVAASYLFLFQNFFTAIVGSTYLLIPTWTLAVEEHFYLFAPLVVRWLSARRLMQVLCVLVVLVMAARAGVTFLGRGAQWSADAANMWTVCRADALALGMILALVWRSEDGGRWLTARARFFAHGIVLFTACGVTLLYLAGSAGLTGRVLLAVFTRTAMQLSCLCLMIYVLTNPDSIACRLLRSEPMRGVGRISYCLYLVHFGVLWMISRFVFHAHLGQSFRRDAASAVLGVATSLLIATLSWRYLEQPLFGKAHARYKY